MKEERCKCNGPYTCKKHDGDFTYCDNPKCLCHGNPTPHTDQFEEICGCGNPMSEHGSGANGYCTPKGTFIGGAGGSGKSAEFEEIEDEFTEAVLISGQSWTTKRIAKWWIEKLHHIRRETEKGIGEAIERIVTENGDNTEVAVNDLLNYAEVLKSDNSTQK